MLWFIAGLSLGTCLGVVVASLCFAAAAAGRRRLERDAPANGPVARTHRHPRPFRSRV